MRQKRGADGASGAVFIVMAETGRECCPASVVVVALVLIQPEGSGVSSEYHGRGIESRWWLERWGKTIGEEEIDPGGIQSLVRVLGRWKMNEQQKVLFTSRSIGGGWTVGGGSGSRSSQGVTRSPSGGTMVDRDHPVERRKSRRWRIAGSSGGRAIEEPQRDDEIGREEGETKGKWGRNQSGEGFNRDGSSVGGSGWWIRVISGPNFEQAQ